MKNNRLHLMRVLCYCHYGPAEPVSLVGTKASTRFQHGGLRRRGCGVGVGYAYLAGVMCIAGHVNAADPAHSVYLEQCMYALGRWHDAFQLAGGK
jgi:hypothetical protein